MSLVVISLINFIALFNHSQYSVPKYFPLQSWRGLKQLLDPRCFVSGEEFVITADFRLTNSTGHGVACDTNYQWNNNEGPQCPSVVVRGFDGCVGGDVYWQFWNSKSVRACIIFAVRLGLS